MPIDQLHAIWITHCVYPDLVLTSITEILSDTNSCKIHVAYLNTSVGRQKVKAGVA